MTPVSYSSAFMGRGTSTVTAGDDRRAIARAFVDARRALSPLSVYPGEPPVTLAEAYAIQDAALGLWTDAVGGWKVGRINAPLDRVLGDNRLSGPVFASRIFEAGAGPAAMPVISGGFAAGEAEFMIRLGPDIGASAALPRTDEETLACIDEVRIGIEIAASPYAGINRDGPCVTISDHGNNQGLVLGAAVPADKWAKLTEIEIVSSIDGHEVGRASARGMLDGPLGAVRFLLTNLFQRRIEPQQGWWISSGAVTGVHEMAAGQTFRAEFDGLGGVACRVES